MVMSRQGMKNMDTTSIEGTMKGAYVVHGAEHATPDVILMGARRHATPLLPAPLPACLLAACWPDDLVLMLVL